MGQNQYPGLFIAVEGPDQSGKRTQVANVGKYLRQLGYGVHETREPWWGQDMTPGDHRLRKLITRAETTENPTEIQDLFIKNRKRHLVYDIIPNLGKGTAVVTARYFFSTMAYGAATTHLTFEDIEDRHHALPWFFVPDLTFVLDISAQEALRRLKKDPDVFETTQTLEVVRGNYLKLAQLFKDSNVVVIAGANSPKVVFEHMRPHIDQAARMKYGGGQMLAEI